jgi:hypothetical protein
MSCKRSWLLILWMITWKVHFPGFRYATNGSLLDECVGFVIHRTEEGGFGNKISSSTALFVTLGRIVDIQAREKCLISTDSSVKALLSRKILHRTHPLVYEYEQMCSDLLWKGFEVKIM